MNVWGRVVGVVFIKSLLSLLTICFFAFLGELLIYIGEEGWPKVGISNEVIYFLAVFALAYTSMFLSTSVILYHLLDYFKARRLYGYRFILSAAPAVVWLVVLFYAAFIGNDVDGMNMMLLRFAAIGAAIFYLKEWLVCRKKHRKAATTKSVL